VKRSRILILGGGFGGVYTAMALERRLRKSGVDAEIALVSRDNYLVFQPMLTEVISGSVGITDTIAPIRRLCPRTDLYTRTIEAIDLTNRVVTTSSGFRPRPYRLEYDHLVIALGGITNFAGQKGLAEHAIPFKYLGDALIVRNRIIHALEEADIEEDAELKRALLTFVVAGSGFSGVEAVAELNDFVRMVAGSFRNISPSEIRVVLLAGSRVLPELPPALGDFALKLMERRGVEIRMNSRLVAASPDSAVTQGGERIATKTLISTVPPAPNPLVDALPCKKDKGKLVVNEFLEVPEYPGVWAIGDCASVPDGVSGQPCPPTAQHATRQAEFCAENIVATLQNRPKRAFAFKALGKLGALGHHSAVAEVFGVKFSGFKAWVLWRGIYLMKLPGLDRKLRVSMAWFLDFFMKPDIVQLRADQAASVGRAHFDANQLIYEQGDRGVRLYVIVDGEIEIVRKDDSQEHVLAKLVPGDCFGEMALVADLPRNAAARSRTEVNLITVDRGAFSALFATLPPLRMLFEQLIAQRSGGHAKPPSTPPTP
jgi:NADH dehydrogenase